MPAGGWPSRSCSGSGARQRAWLSSSRPPRPSARRPPRPGATRSWRAASVTPPRWRRPPTRRARRSWRRRLAA
eukprot:scaffold474599_cov24-Prasinocladus_malaysianus.AAC.1